MTGQLVESKQYINQTSNRIALGSTRRGKAASPKTASSLRARRHPRTSPDSRLRPRLIGTTDRNGRPLQTATNLADRMNTVLGLPTAYSRAVTGRIGASRDEGRHRARPVWLRTASDDDLLARLAAYAVDDLTSASRTL